MVTRQWRVKLHCSGNPKSSNCSLEQCAVNGFWLGFSRWIVPNQYVQSCPAFGTAVLHQKMTAAFVHLNEISACFEQGPPESPRFQVSALLVRDVSVECWPDVVDAGPRLQPEFVRIQSLA